MNSGPHTPFGIFLLPMIPVVVFGAAISAIYVLSRGKVYRTQLTEADEMFREAMNTWSHDMCFVEESSTCRELQEEFEE